MTGFKKAFVDTAPFIYFIEKDSNNPQYYEKVKGFFRSGYDSGRKFVSSVITMEEYFVFPYRNKAYDCDLCANAKGYGEIQQSLWNVGYKMSAGSIPV